MFARMALILAVSLLLGSMPWPYGLMVWLFLLVSGDRPLFRARA
jgi:hypothetical protein